MLMQNWVWIMDELISIHRSHDHGISKHIVLVCLMRVEGHQREKKKNRKERDSTWEKCVYIKGRSWELNRIAQQSMLSKNMQNNKLCHKTHEHLKCNTCSFSSNMAGAELAIFLTGSFIFCLFEMGLNLLINLVKWGEKVVFEVDGGLGDLESISCDFVNVQIRSTIPDCKQLLGHDHNLAQSLCCTPFTLGL